MTNELTRRDILRGGAVGLGALAVPEWAFPALAQGEELVEFTDYPDGWKTERGPETRFYDIRNIDGPNTPANEFFTTQHLGHPQLDGASFRLKVTGLVDRPATLSLDDLKALGETELDAGFECSGNSARAMQALASNARWTGVPLQNVLDDVGVKAAGREVVFFGADTGEEEIRRAKVEMHFARSLSIEDASRPEVMLAYEMNGEPLPAAHGFPVRLIVPGWYGIAQVKWLQRIGLGADRLMTRFMAKDYVTLMGREENGRTEWLETSVTHQRVKSVVARVTRSEDRFTIFGVAWSDGTPLDRVEVRVDDGAWSAATMDRPEDPHTWTFFTFETEGLGSGEHTIVSRATDLEGRTQPVDLSMKRTRWENNELFERTIQVS